MNPQDLKYTEEHEWVRVESDGVAVLGVTEFAAEHLGDIVFLDLPDADTEIAQLGKLGEIESVKAVSDIYSPVSGSVVERNEQAVESPEIVNASPYESGWLLKVTYSDPSEMDKLMSAEEYEAFLATQEG